MTLLACYKCGKKTEHNTKFRLNNFPYCFALSCNECGRLFYY